MSIETFKVRLDRALSNQHHVIDVPAHCRGVGLEDLEQVSQLKLFYDYDRVLFRKLIIPVYLLEDSLLSQFWKLEL